MIKIIQHRQTVMAAGLFFLFISFSIPVEICTALDFHSALHSSSTKRLHSLDSPEYPDYNLSTSSRDNFYALSPKDRYHTTSLPTFSWVNFLSAKMMEKRDVFPWSTPDIIQEDRFDEVGGMNYELYDGEFRHIDTIRQDIVTELAQGTAEELFKKTRTGQKLDMLSRRIAGYLTVQYLKREDSGSEFIMPGRSSVSQSVQVKNQMYLSEPASGGESHGSGDIYGLSFSVRLFNDVNSNPLEYALELNSFYLNTMLRIRYEPADERSSLSFTDRRFQEILDCRAALEFVSEPRETYGILRLYFDF
ncbi:MAG: hypothetical protein HQK66_01795 [Desulfamplus sp.]|nr:hypothetical protein [Desulfamplus sp.]